MIRHLHAFSRTNLRTLCLGLAIALVSCNPQPVGDKDKGDKGNTAMVPPSTTSDTTTIQQEPEPAPIDISQYKEKIAPFKIRLVDGKGYTYKDLDKNKETILVYFQPDCPECQAFAAALTKRASKIPEKQIVMICFATMQELKKFDKQYHLSEHPNIKIGSEGYTFVVQQYYQINHFPFVASYNKAGKLVRILNPNLKAEVMAARL